MINLLFFCIIGFCLYLIIFKTGQLIGYTKLYNIRENTTSNQYYHILKKCDICMILYNLIQVLFGVTITLKLLNIMNFIYVDNYLLLSTLIIIIIVGVIIELIAYFNNFKYQKEIISKQWVKQKKISETNDDEVNTYNTIKLIENAKIWVMLMIVITSICLFF